MLVIKRLEQRLAPQPEKAEIVLRIHGHKPIVITLCEARSGSAKLGILAPPEVVILRGELDLAPSVSEQT